MNVTKVEINGGEPITFRRGDQNVPVFAGNQNSVVHHIMVEFSAPVTLDAGAFTLATKPVTVNHAPSPSGTAPSLSWRQMAGGNGRTWIITFSGAGSNATTGKLANGVYDLTIHADKVHSDAGSLASDQVRTVVALLACRIDFDDDTSIYTAKVDGSQVNLFTRHAGTAAGDPGFPGYSVGADVNLDGYCDPADLFAVADVNGASWSWPA